MTRPRTATVIGLPPTRPPMPPALQDFDFLFGVPEALEEFE